MHRSWCNGFSACSTLCQAFIIPPGILKKVFGKLKEISVCSLGMHIRRLWMAVQSLQTEISARCVGHFSTLPSSVQHAANATAACRGGQASPRRLFRTMPTAGHQCTASPFGTDCGAAPMMSQKKDRSVTERFVAACLWAAQPDEASPVTERLLM